MRTHLRATFCGLALACLATRPARAADDASAEAELAREARLDTILRLARARNPDVLELAERARAAEAHADFAGGLEDAQLKAELWGVPLDHPVSFARASTIMLGARQALPAPGTRDLRARVAREEAGALAEDGRTRGLELARQVRHAYAQYWRAEQEVRIHLEHVGLLAQIVDYSRGHYQSGHGSQQDLLRLTVELSQLHADVATLEQERRSSRALLNTLMGRAPDALLGPPPEAALFEDAPTAPPDAGQRPEVAAALRNVRRAEATLELARRAARWPAVMVGADYWYMPTQADVHGYGAMVAIDLPWLNPRHGAEVREAELALGAERRALDGKRAAAAYEALDADARVDAARAALGILDGDLLPQARRSYESAEAAYQSGQGSALALLDAMRAYLQVRLERGRALARLATSRADRDRAVGRAGDDGAGGRP
ncbi:MAG TPA: TolC family protein [Polyangia bacterium]|nr:TolC family protein [Polyangia bacterium]